MSTVDTNYLTSLLSLNQDAFVKKLEDNTFDNNAVLKMIRDKSKVTIMNGGRTLKIPLMIGGNTTVDSYSYYDNLDITPSKGLVDAETTKANYAVSIVMSGQELRENAGETQIIELMGARMTQGELSLSERINSDLYLDGTGNASKNIIGLLAMIPSSATPGTYLGIDGAVLTKWKAQYTAGAVATLIADITGAFYKQVDGGDAPDLCLTDALGLELYEAANHTAGLGISYGSAAMADAGFISLKFKGIDMVLDNAHPQNSAAQPIYHFLNSKYLGMNWNSGGITEFVKPADQDAKVGQILVETQLVTSNRRRQGKIVFTS